MCFVIFCYVFQVCERLCFYYLDDKAHVICRGCYKRFVTWLEFRKHFDRLLCHITEINYKLNTYSEVYKKYKLKKAKTKKKINDCLNAAQLMDLETLNIRKTRKRYNLKLFNKYDRKQLKYYYYFRCYTNTRVVVNNSKSSSDSSSSNSEKTVKMTKKDRLENCISSDESVVETKSELIDNVIAKFEDIPDSTNINVPNLPQGNQSTTTTIKMEWNASDVFQGSSDDQSSSSVHCEPKYKPKEHKSDKYQYICVICDEKFSSKCLLTMHQVQHIKSDRSSYGVFMAALARTA